MRKVVFDDIAIIRVILVISIIIGHAFNIYTGSSYWPLPEGCSENDNLNWVNPIFISFSLQAFVFISGYLFEHKSKFALQNKSRFLISKFKRIYITSIIFSFFYVIIIEGTSQKDLMHILYSSINGAGHLWFLPMLFWCNLITILFYNKISEFSLMKFILLGAIGLVAPLIDPVLRISTAFNYIIYFVLGIWVYKNKYNIKDRPSLVYIFVGWCFIALFCILKVFLISNDVQYGFVYMSVNELSLGIIGSLTLYLTINYLIHKYRVKNIFRTDVWYGIYIYHQFVLMLIYYKTSLPIYCNIYIPYLGVLFSLFISYFLVVITLKNRFGRFLIG